MIVQSTIWLLAGSSAAAKDDVSYAIEKNKVNVEVVEYYRGGKEGDDVRYYFKVRGKKDHIEKLFRDISASDEQLVFKENVG